MTNSEAATVSVTIEPVNDVPTAFSQALSTPEDTGLPFLLEGTDEDGDALSYVVITQPTNGILTGTAPNLTYTPVENANGNDFFTYVVSDAAATSETATVTIEILPVNDVPVANDLSVTGLEDRIMSILLSGRDDDGDTLSYIILSQPTNGSLSGTAPALTYSPAENAHDADSFTFYVSDGVSTSVAATVSITVAEVNDAPVANEQSLSVLEDQILNILISGSDVDGDTLSFIVTTQPTNGVLTGTAPNLTYTPSIDFNGNDHFTFTVSDTSSTSGVAEVLIEVEPVNDVPVASSRSFTMLEDADMAVLLEGSDVDGDVISYLVVSSPTNGTLSGIAPDLLYEPSANVNGADSFLFSVTDGVVTSAPAAISIVIDAVNDVPTAMDQSLATLEDEALSIMLSGNDVDGDELVYTLGSQPTNGTLSGNAPDLTYTPEADWHGTDGFAFTVSDGSSTSSMASVSITVDSVNDAPVAVAQSVSTSEDTNLSIILEGTDVDGDALSFIIVEQPGRGVLSGTAPNLVYEPVPNATGEDQFTFSVSDGVVTSETAIVSVMVDAVNDAPVGEDQFLTILEDQSLEIVLSGSDAENDALSYAIAQEPVCGMLTGTVQNLTYEPAPDFNGWDVFYFTASDAVSTSDVSLVVIYVEPVNDAPVTFSQSLTNLEDHAVSITLEGSDAEEDSLAYAIFSYPTNGTLSGVALDLTYTPNADYFGVDSFSFVASDAFSTSDVSTVSIQIDAVNDAPSFVASDPPGITTVDGEQTLAGWATASAGPASESDQLLEFVVTNVSPGTAFAGLPTVDVNGTLSYEVADGLTGTFQFDVAVRDSGGVENGGTNVSPFQTFAISVIPVTNQAPEIEAINFDGKTSPYIFIAVTNNWTNSLTDYPVRMTIPYRPQMEEDFSDLYFTDEFDNKLNYWIEATAPSEAAQVWIRIPSLESNGVAEVYGRYGDLSEAPGSDGDGVFTFHDDFSETSLKEGWEFFNPSEDDSYSLSERPGWMRVKLYGLSDSWGHANDAPFLYTDIPTNGNYIIETMADAWDVHPGQHQILAWLRTLELGVGARGYYGAYNQPYSLRYEYDGSHYGFDDKNVGSTVQRLRFRTDGSDVYYDWSIDGIVWNNHGSHTPETRPGKWGLGAKSWAEGNFVADFDYFIIRKYVSPEPTVCVGRTVAPTQGTLEPVVRDDGSPQNSSLAYEWTQLSGPTSIQFSDSFAIAPDIQVPNAGNYEVQLIVSDGELSATGSVELVLGFEYNQAPFVYVDPLVVANLSEAVVLDSQVEDEGLPYGTLDFAWRALWDSDKVAFGSPNVATTTCSFTEFGVYYLELAVSDGHLTTTKRVQVLVEGVTEIDITDDVVSWWRANGDFSDEFGLNSDGYCNEGNVFSNGITGGGFDLDNNQGITIPASDSLSMNGEKSFSFEFWMKFDELNDWDVRFLGWANDGVYLGRIGDDLRAWFRTPSGANSSATANNVLSTGVWQHVAVTYNAETDIWSLYLDGRQRDSRAVESLTTSHDFHIGAANVRYWSGMDGMIDELVLYNRALNAGEVYNLYAAGPSGKLYDGDVSNAPIVDAGETLYIASPNDMVHLNGVIDGGVLGISSNSWINLFGPGDVVFADPSDPQTTCAFSEPGSYTLGLWASNQAGTTLDEVHAYVEDHSGGGINIADDVISWWRAEGDFADETGLNSTGWRNYGNAFSNGITGFGFSLHGDQTITIPASDSLSIHEEESFSIEFWMKPEILTGESRFLGWMLDELYVGREGTKLQAAYKTPNGTYDKLEAYSALSAGTWTHIVVVFDNEGNTYSLYTDGQLRDVGTVDFLSTSDDFRIGKISDFWLWKGLDGTLDEVVLYNRALSATEISAFYQTGPDGKLIIDGSGNQPPVVFAGTNATVYLADSYLLNPTVIDDGLPEGSVLTYVWSQVSGPAIGQFSDVNALAPQVSFTQVGTYELQLAVSDGELSASNTVMISVMPEPNQPPVVDAGPDMIASLETGAVMAGMVTDDGLPDGTLTHYWSVSSGSSDQVSSPDNTLLDAEIVFPKTGIYTLMLLASDGEYTLGDTVNVDVRPGPEVSLVSPTNNQAYTQGETVSFEASASDADGTVVSVEFLLDDVSVAVDSTAPYELSLSSIAVGTHRVQAVAVDNDGLSAATAPVFFYVDPAAAPTNSQLVISSPEDSGVVSAPTDIIGTVSGLVLDHYTLEVRMVDSAASGEWTEFASGTTAVSNGVLGQFDPTLMLNGMVEIRLTAEDIYGYAFESEPVALIVDGNMKIGHFTLSFSDMKVPLQGIPIEVMRTYDSRNTQQGDFGLGWTLGLKDIRLQKNRSLAEKWEQKVVSFSLGYGNYEMNPYRNRIVSVALSDGTIYRFEARFSPSEQFAVPILSGEVLFDPLPGTHASLEITEPQNLRVVGGIPQPDQGRFEGFVSLMDYNKLELFNPKRFKLTLPEGTVLYLHEDSGLEKVVDAFGNEVEYRHDGIYHSNGASVQFVRDASGRIEQVIDPDGNALVYRYDTEGHLAEFENRESEITQFFYENVNFPHVLTRIVDPTGADAIRTEYDENGRMVRQIDSDGNPIEMNHDIPNRRETVTDRLGNTTVHEYDSNGNVISTTQQLDNQQLTTSYTYDEWDNQLSKTDPLGRTTSWTYDESDNQTSETDPLGNTTTTTYNGNRNPLSITDANGNTTWFEYGEHGELTNMVDAAGNTTMSLTYDEWGRMTSQTVALGYVTTYLYDSAGNMLSKSAYLTVSTNSTPLTTSYTYDSRGNRTSETRTVTSSTAVLTPLTSQYVYDTENRLVETIDPHGNSSFVEYDANGKETARIDELGRRTEQVWNDRGERIQVLYPDGTSVGYGYDLEGRKIAETNQAGFVTQFVYDALGRQTHTIHPDGATEETVFDAIGREIEKIDALGNSTLYAHSDDCDCSGRAAYVEDALGNGTWYEYDANGNRIVMQDANGNETLFHYDEMNREIRVEYPDGTTQEKSYNAKGLLVQAIDQSGVATDYAYDALGRLVSVSTVSTNLTVSTSYTYDELGHQIAQTDANGHTTRYEYDALGRRTKRILPEGQVEITAYNAVGLPVARTDFNGKTTTFTHDAMNRITAKVPDASFGAPSITFGYDARGLRTSMTDAHGTTTYTYNERGLRTQKASPNGTLDYTHNAQGNLVSTSSDHVNGLSLTYGYDELNRLRTVVNQSTGLTRYDYDPVGNLAFMVHPNGVNHVYEYDHLNRLTNLTVNALATPIRSYAYTLAATGHRLGVVESHGREVSYQYDNLYRLTQETVAEGLDLGQVDYVLDAVGNRLSRTSTLPGVPSQTFSYSANDWLTSDTYDSNGNTVASSLRDDPGTASDQYDFENRLIKRTTTSGDVIEITYDGDGNRVQKRVNGIPKWYLVDDNNHTGYAQVVEELGSDLSGLVVNTVYSYGHDLISQERFDFVSNAWKPHYYSYDGHGNVRFLTDSTGIITDTYDYDAFGLLIDQQVFDSSVGALVPATTLNLQLQTLNSYLYAGEQYDSDLGMYFLRARYMEPDRGRFWTMDTYEGRGYDPATLHKYLYCHADPVNYVDPSGMYLNLTELTLSSTIIGMFAGAYTGFQATHTWEGAGKGMLLGAFTGFIAGSATYALAGGSAATITAAHLSLSAALADTLAQVAFLPYGRSFNPRQTLVIVTATYFTPGLAIVLKGTAGVGLGEATTFLHALSSAITQIVADAINYGADRLEEE